MMKKIIAFLLALTCTFALVACLGNTDTCTEHVDENFDGVCDKCGAKVENQDAQTQAFAAFVAAIANTNPSQQNIEVKVETDIGELNGSFAVTYNADGSATIEYSYEQFNELPADEAKTVVTGTVTRAADGAYSGAITGTVGTSATEIQLNLAAVKSSCVIEDEFLSVTVPAASNAAVFGVDLQADVTLAVIRSGDKIANYSLTYTSAYGQVTIRCTYQ